MPEPGLSTLEEPQSDRMGPGLMTPVRLTVFLCLAEVFSMASFASFATLAEHFMQMWSLTETDAGFISGVYLAGYVVGAPILNSLTDRIDARRVYLWSTAFTALTVLGFVFLAEGYWTAMAFRALTGFGLAGTYMPGLKALTDRAQSKSQSRYVAFYTSSYGVGAALSYMVTSYVFEFTDWQWAVATGAIGSMLCWAVAFVVLDHRPPKRPEAGEGEKHLLDFRPVFANRRAMGYILAYSLHNLELFGLRAWVVLYLAYSQFRLTDTATWWDAATIAAAITIVGWAASVSGNEAALKWGRSRVITVVMWSSALVACLIGFISAWPFWLIVLLGLFYGATVTGDSAAITAGAVAAAREGQRGATLAMHSTIGFVGAAIGPVLFGWVLELGGGKSNPDAWGYAFASMGVAVFLGPVALRLLSRQKSDL
jgi:MFS family permease